MRIHHISKQKKLLIISLSVLSIAIAILVFGSSGTNTYIAQSVSRDLEKNVEVADTRPYVVVNDVTIPVLVADTNALRVKGLSGMPSLPLNEGMFFIFTNPDQYRFWMPDMNFPIDIIWIADGKIIEIEHNVSNAFDPKHPVFYMPPSPIRHVLEVNAGFSKAQGIQVGDTITFYDTNE